MLQDDAFNFNLWHLPKMCAPFCCRVWYEKMLSQIGTLTKQQFGSRGADLNLRLSQPEKKTMYGLVWKQSFSIMMHGPPEGCGGVCICRDSSLCLYFLIFWGLGPFWASTSWQWVCSPWPITTCRVWGRDSIRKHQSVKQSVWHHNLFFLTIKAFISLWLNIFSSRKLLLRPKSDPSCLGWGLFCRGSDLHRAFNLLQVWEPLKKKERKGERKTQINSK